MNLCGFPTSNRGVRSISSTVKVQSIWSILNLLYNHQCTACAALNQIMLVRFFKLENFYVHLFYTDLFNLYDLSQQIPASSQDEGEGALGGEPKGLWDC